MNSSESSESGKSPEPEKTKADSPQAGAEVTVASKSKDGGASAGASGQDANGGAGAASAQASERRRKRALTLMRLRRRYSIVTVLILLFVVYIAVEFWPRVFYVIGSGQTGVLYRFFWGTQTDKTYSEGLTILFPWNSLFIYDVREQERSEDVEVLSYNGLIISVSLSYRFQPDADRVALIHQRLGPEYASKLVQPLLQSTVREVIGNYRPEELFTTHSATLQEEIGQIAQRKIEPYFVHINQIFVKRVKLPETVEKAIQDKLVLQQVAEGYDFRLVSEERERQRKVIESDGIRQYNTNIAGALTAPVLRYMSIRAMDRLATSANSKVVVLGGKEGEGLMLPLSMNDLNAPAPTSTGALPGGAGAENGFTGMSSGSGQGPGAGAGASTGTGARRSALGNPSLNYTGEGTQGASAGASGQGASGGFASGVSGSNGSGSNGSGSNGSGSNVPAEGGEAGADARSGGAPSTGSAPSLLVPPSAEPKGPPPSGGAR